MISFAADAVLREAREAFQAIGYRHHLLIEDYRFADILDPAYNVREIPLAAFAQEPTSYRNACFGVSVGAGNSPAAIGRFRALGAPQIFDVDVPTGEVRRWKMTAEGDPRLVEQLHASELRARIESERGQWGPEQVLRAKTIGYDIGPAQLDFYDTGLLPVLEREVHERLDRLLRNVVTAATEAYVERRNGRQPDAGETRDAFRLIFRLLAAKLLADRRYPGNWTGEDPIEVVRRVDRHYFGTSHQDPDETDSEVGRVIWSTIRSSFHLENVSVEALAYVYENTLVSPETRRVFDTHATPPLVAEYVVRQLPFESVERDKRRVFEPFAGHAPFLIAAAGRLKSLLPADLTGPERHDYLRRRLTGMELDAFAREVARYSLMLADYPNPNGWQLREGDVFTSAEFETELADATAVLANPPYGDFRSPQPGQNPNKAVEAVTRIMRRPPPMLGLVLPRKFVDGASYRDARKAIAARYDHTQVAVLPDAVFSHSDVETAVVIASELRPSWGERVSLYVSKADYERFLERKEPTQRDAWASRDRALWRPRLAEVWEALRGHATLDALTSESGRGIEYVRSVRAEGDKLFSTRPRKGFRLGLLTVTPEFEPFVSRPTHYLNVASEEMRGHAFRKPWSEPKVIANANRKARGPWALAAIVDRDGLVCYQTFHGFWPAPDVPLEVLAAILNGPVANAYVATHNAKRHNQIGVIRSVPVPVLTTAVTERLVSLVRSYELHRRAWLRLGPLSGGDIFRGDEVEHERLCRELLLQIDAAVLGAYDLTPRLERRLLDHFEGHRRPGPVEFLRYYPVGFRATIPWGMYISDAFRASTAGDTLARMPVVDDPDVSEMVADLG